MPIGTPLASIDTNLAHQGKSDAPHNLMCSSLSLRHTHHRIGHKMKINSRPTHIEDYLITVRTGQWFGWSDSKNKIYANLVVLDGGAKPSESDCTNGLKALQDAWDLENDSYKSKRRAEYPSVVDQLDDLYHNGIDGWKTTIKAVKDKYPKE